MGVFTSLLFFSQRMRLREHVNLKPWFSTSWAGEPLFFSSKTYIIYICICIYILIYFFIHLFIFFDSFIFLIYFLKFMEVEGPSIRFPGGCCPLHGRAPLSPEGGSAGLVPWELAKTSPSPHRRRPRQRWICPGMDRAKWSRRRQLQPGTWWEQHLELYENESGDGLGVSLRWCDCDF